MTAGALGPTGAGAEANTATRAGGPAHASPAGGGLPDIPGHRLLRKLGEGGMGAVFLAEDVALGRAVAVKVISTDRAGDDSARARFLREARSMASVEHPHVARIYSFGESAGGLHIVMEYVSGESLANRIRRDGPLTVAEAARIASEIADGLDAAWERGLVHRDVKPSNVLLDARDRVRVADFGLAKPLTGPGEDTALTHSGHFIGTPQYLAPEQALGVDVDFRCDLYSLGIVLYEMLTGTRPFVGNTPVAIIAQHLQSPLPSVLERRPDTPPSLVALLEAMTAKDPGRRPASYREVRRALDLALAAPPSWTTGSPFRGLAPFDPEHATIFFGRRAAVREVSERLHAQAASGRAFVLVLGMSGSGKSSLVRAGVVPAILRPGAVPGVREWRSVIVSAGEIAAAAGAIVPRAISEPLPDGARLLLVVDQLEELFTSPSIGAERRRAFVEELSGLARSGSAWVLATMRSDFFGHCEELPDLMALKEGGGLYHLLPPTPGEIGQMIRGPARAAGLRFEEGADTGLGVDDLLQDAASGQIGSLPLLEFALEELYEERAGDLLTVQAYRRMGGVEGALTRRAEAVFNGLSSEVQASLPGVFSSLVHVRSGDGEAPLRMQAAQSAFASAEAMGLVSAFVEARLFLADRSLDGQAIISVAHEALLRSWPRVREWLDRNRELLRVHARVAAAASRWIELGRPADLLLHEGKPVEEALPLLSAGIELSQAERAFVAASDASARRRRRARQLMNANSLLLLGGLAASLSYYLARVLPTVAAITARHGELLPWLVRAQIVSARWVVRALLVFALAALVLRLFRVPLRIPEFVRSGMALAVGTGVLLLVTLVGFLSAMIHAVRLLADAAR